MIKYIAIMILTLTSLTANASDFSDFYAEPDKKKHMQYSALATNLMYWGGMSKWEAFTTMMVIGALKEQMDNHNTEEEHHRDMLANMMGASTVFVWEWRF